MTGVTCDTARCQLWHRATKCYCGYVVNAPVYRVCFLLSHITKLHSSVFECAWTLHCCGASPSICQSECLPWHSSTYTCLPHRESWPQWSTSLCIFSPYLNQINVYLKAKLIGEEEFRSCLNKWWGMLCSYILPALSMTCANAAFNVEVWNVLKVYDQTECWRMYGKWAWAYMLYLELRVRHVEVTREVCGILLHVMAWAPISSFSCCSIWHMWWISRTLSTVYSECLIS